MSHPTDPMLDRAVRAAVRDTGAPFVGTWERVLWVGRRWAYGLTVRRAPRQMPTVRLTRVPSRWVR